MKVFVPGHITSLFFPVMDENPLKAGSRGAGVSISHGYEVSVELVHGNGIQIFQNGEKIPKEKAKITYEVAKEYSDIIGKKILIKQNFNIPTGSGYGSSAAGSLGTSICLGYLKNKTLHDASRIAHRKEVIHGGGLGDVYPQIVGGIEVRRKEGAPGYGWVDNLIVNDDWKVVSASYGNLDTSKILNNETKTNKIQTVSKKKIKQIINSPNLKSLMKYSREFVEEVNLIENPIDNIFRELDKVMRINPSMIMLGKSVFGFVSKDNVKKVSDVLNRYEPEFGPIISEIDYRGARVI